MGVCEATLEGHGRAVWACAFSPDGEMIVSASKDRTLKLWDARTGAERATLVGHRSWVRACVFSPDGQTILSASVDRTLRLWDTQTGAELVAVSALGELRACAFSPHGDLVCCGDSGGTVYILELMGAWPMTDADTDPTPPAP